MQTWLKYCLSFFALILILTGFIYAFGPASTRQAFRSGETQTGQLNSNASLTSPGEPLAADAPAVMPETQSGTSRATQTAPALSH